MSATLSGMDRELVSRLAGRLYEAEIERRPIDPLTSEHPDLTSELAYQIQLAVVERKVSQGRKVVGKKIGLTSRPIQQLLGVDQPDYGHLLDDMSVLDGGIAPMNHLLQPRVEGELAFVLNKKLQGPGITKENVLAATATIRPAIEIIDSRIGDWKIALADTIADNASSGLFVLGEPQRTKDFDLRLMGMVLEKNREIALTGAGAAVLGHPAEAVAWLANKLADFEIALEAEEVILSGSFSSALPVAPGDEIKVEFDRLGDVTVSFQ